MKDKGLRACILVKARSGKAAAVAQQLGKLEGVERAAVVFGTVDVIAHARVAELHALSHLLGEVGRTEGVLSTETLPGLEVR